MNKHNAQKQCHCSLTKCMKGLLKCFIVLVLVCIKDNSSFIMICSTNYITAMIDHILNISMKHYELGQVNKVKGNKSLLSRIRV